MAYCKPCYYTNHIRRTGGDLGLCWQHKKKKCRNCRELSAGKVYCTKCEYGAQIIEYKGESARLYYDDDHEFIQIQLRREKLWESKRHVHRAIEIFFRALLLILEAIWGGIKQEPQKPEKKQDIIDPGFEEAA